MKKIIIHRSKNKQFYFTVVKRGRVLATSETYKRKAGCIKGIVATITVCVTLPLSKLIIDMTAKKK